MGRLAFWAWAGTAPAAFDPPPRRGLNVRRRLRHDACVLPDIVGVRFSAEGADDGFRRRAVNIVRRCEEACAEGV